jgi:hypothetical protein
MLENLIPTLCADIMKRETITALATTVPEPQTAIRTTTRTQMAAITTPTLTGVPTIMMGREAQGTTHLGRRSDVVHS